MVPWVLALMNVVSLPLALEIGCAKSAAGSVRGEIQDVQSKPLNGFELAECLEIFGDTITGTVAWKATQYSSPVSGNSVRLRFEIRDADLYSFQSVR